MFVTEFGFDRLWTTAELSNASPKNTTFAVDESFLRNSDDPVMVFMTFSNSHTTIRSAAWSHIFPNNSFVTLSSIELPVKFVFVNPVFLASMPRFLWVWATASSSSYKYLPNTLLPRMTVNPFHDVCSSLASCSLGAFLYLCRTRWAHFSTESSLHNLGQAFEKPHISKTPIHTMVSSHMMQQFLVLDLLAHRNDIDLHALHSPESLDLSHQLGAVSAIAVGDDKEQLGHELATVRQDLLAHETQSPVEVGLAAVVGDPVNGGEDVRVVVLVAQGQDDRGLLGVLNEGDTNGVRSDGQHRDRVLQVLGHFLSEEGFAAVHRLIDQEDNFSGLLNWTQAFLVNCLSSLETLASLS